MIVMPPVFNAGDTIYFYFDSYDSNGASVTITGLAVTDIEVYKNGSTTQRSSDSGYALLDTDGIDFDGVTGLHGFSIDTSDNTDSGFWADGAQYLVNVNSVTIDSQTVRFSYMLTLGYLLRPTTAGRKLDVSSGGEAGLDWANIGSPTTSVSLSGTSTKALEPTTAGRTLDVTATGEAGIDWGNIGSPTSTVNLSGTSTKALEPTTAGRTLDVASTGEAGLDFDNIKQATGATTLTNITVPTVTTTGTATNLTNAPTAGDFTNTMKTSIGTAVAASAVASVTGNVGGNVVGSVASVSGAVGSVTGNVGGNVSGSVGSVTGNVGGNVVGSVASVTAGVTVSTNNDKTGYSLSVTPPTAAAIADAVLDEAMAGHTTAGTLGKAVADILVDTGTTIPDLIEGIEGGGGGGGGSVTYETQEVPVGEHYVETGDSLTPFRFRTYQLVDGAFELHTYDDLELALYVDGVLSGTVPTWTEVSEGVIQLAGTLPTITAGQRLRIEASTVDGDTTNDVWFGIVPTAGAEAGTGARTVTITVNDSTDPLEGARVRLSQGAETLVQSTNVSGVATFNLDDATWSVAITKAGYSFAGASLVVNGNETQTYSMSLLVTTPGDPDETTAFLTVRTTAGVAVEGAIVQLEILKLENGSTGNGINNPLASETTDANGYVEFPGLPRLATYQVRIGDGKWFKGVTLDADTTPLAGALGLAE